MKKLVSGALAAVLLVPGTASAAVTYGNGVIKNDSYGYSVKTTASIKRAIRDKKVIVVKNKDVKSKYGYITRKGTFSLYYKVKGQDQMLVNLEYEPKKLSKAAFKREVGYGTYLGVRGNKTYYYVLPTGPVEGALGNARIGKLINDVPSMMKTFRLR